MRKFTFLLTALAASVGSIGTSMAQDVSSASQTLNGDAGVTAKLGNESAEAGGQANVQSSADKTIKDSGVLNGQRDGQLNAEANASDTLPEKSILNGGSGLDAQTKLDAQANTNAKSEARIGQQSSADATLQNSTTADLPMDRNNAITGSVDANGNASALNGSLGVQGNTNSNTSASAQQKSFGEDQAWRYREFDGRNWYWQGDRSNGGWYYWNGGQWMQFQGSTASQAQASNSQMGLNANAYGQAQSRVSGYRGTTTGAFDGPYYFDNAGRRYYQNGNAYLPDQNFNTRIWNDDFSTSIRDVSNQYGSPYSGVNNSSSLRSNVGDGAANLNLRNSTNVQGAIGRAIGGQTGARLNGASVRQNVGGSIGQAIGGNAGGQIGAGIGAAIGNRNQ